MNDKGAGPVVHSLAVRRSARFSPFTKEALRWALRAYRWKKGIAWEYYADEMRAVLGFKKGDPGINDKDPRPFVEFKNEPTAKKLRHFEQFVRKACPEYLNALTETGRLNQVGDALFAFLSLNRVHPTSYAAFQSAARRLESFLFYKMDTQEDARPEPCVVAFRKLGDTPYLAAYMFEPGELSPSQDRRVTAKLSEAENFKAGPDTPIRFFHSGILLPVEHPRMYADLTLPYIGLLKDATNHLVMVYAQLRKAFYSVGESEIREADRNLNDWAFSWHYYTESTTILPTAPGTSFQPFKNKSLEELVSTFGVDLI